MLIYIHLIKTKKHSFLLFSHGKDSIPVANPSLAQASTQDPKKQTEPDQDDQDKQHNPQNNEQLDDDKQLLIDLQKIGDTVSENESDSEYDNDPYDNFQQENSQIDHNENVVSNEHQSNLSETTKSSENQIVQNNEVVKQSDQKNTKTSPSNNTIKLNLSPYQPKGSKSNSNNKIYYTTIIIFGFICLSLVFLMLYDNKKSKSTDH